MTQKALKSLCLISAVSLLPACTNMRVGTHGIQDESPFGILPPQNAPAMVQQARQKIEKGGQAHTAYTLLNEAKRYDEPQSYAVMGRMYEGGQGVAPVNFIARDHYWTGALSQDGEAMYQTALRQLEREAHNKNSEAPIAQARRWVRLQSGLPATTSEGMQWMHEAAATGHPEANLYLARYYFDQNQNARAQPYLNVVLAAGLVEGKRILARHYENGTGGFEQSYKQAFAIYADMAEVNNDAQAMHAMGFFFVRGLHGVKDDIAAVHWYHQAAKAGNPDSMLAYAWMVENGVGTEKDPDEARFYYALAQKRGADAIQPPKS